MTTQGAVNLFRLLIDKYGSPYFTDSEVIDLLMMAHYEYINRLIPDNQGGVVNMEFDSNVLQNLKPLIWQVAVNSTSGGLVATATLDTALRTASGDSTTEVLRILGIGYNDTEVRYLKHNNLWSFVNNVYKAPSTSKVRFTVRGDGYQFYPQTTLNNLTFSLLKKPKTLALTPTPVNPELGDYQMMSVVALAVKLAGVSVRDEELLQDARLSGLQLTQ